MWVDLRYLYELSCHTLWYDFYDNNGNNLHVQVSVHGHTIYAWLVIIMKSLWYHCPEITLLYQKLIHRKMECDISDF